MSTTIERVSHGWAYTTTMTEAEVASFPSHRHCPICDSTDDCETLVEIGQREWKSRLRVVQCSSCHGIFYANPPPPEYIARFYEAIWNTAGGERVEGEIKTPTGVKRRIARLLEDLRFARRDAAILDIGCGKGDLLAGLAEAGFTDLWGTEMSPFRAAASDKRFPGRVFQGGYAAVPDERRFDIIYANHVIEHIYNAHEAFAWMQAHLKPDGLIILSVPDSWFEPVVNQVLFLPHLHSFCARSFEQMAVRRNLACQFWTADRRWELTAVFTANTDRLPQGRRNFSPYAQLNRRSDGSQRERLRRPWTGAEGAMRVLSLAQIYKRETEATDHAGYLALSGASRLLARLTADISRSLNGLSLSRWAHKLGGTGGYLQLRIHPDTTSAPIVGDGAGNAVLLIK